MDDLFAIYEHDHHLAAMLDILRVSYTNALWDIVQVSAEEKIESQFDWPAIVVEAGMNAEPDSYDDHALYGRVFLGTVFALSPSGKYYAPWDTLPTQDSIFYDALNVVAEQHGGWIECGEGDPCDLFFVRKIESEK